MNWTILTAALIAGATTLIHVFLGGRDVVVPLLRSGLSEDVRLTMYACWHMVSAALGLTAVTLFLIGASVIHDAGLARLLGILWLLFALVFLVVNLVLARPRGLFRFPQWTLILPVGVLALWGGQ